LLVDSFALIDVHLPLRHGLVPYWTVFSTRAAADELVDYLDHTRRALARAGGTGGYCGVDRAAYPQDFASNRRFHDRLAALGDGRPSDGPPAGWPWVRDRLSRHLADRCVSAEFEPV
jgi:hypothetical protein